MIPILKTDIIDYYLDFICWGHLTPTPFYMKIIKEKNLFWIGIESNQNRFLKLNMIFFINNKNIFIK